MIEQITGYVVTCDECGASLTFNESDQAVFEDDFVAEQVAIESGWRKVPGKLLCEDCYHDYLNHEEEGGVQ